MAASRGLWILVPPPWIEASPLAVEAQSLDHWTTGAFPFCYLKVKKFIYILAVLGLCCCTSLSLVAVSRGYFSVAVHWLLTAMPSLVAECGLQGTWASVVAACRLSSCGSRALKHKLDSCGVEACGIFPDQGSNLYSPALAGRFFTTEPPGKPLFLLLLFLNKLLIHLMVS